MKNNPFETGEHIFDKDSKNNDFEITFVQDTVTVDPNHPQTPGSPINPGDPNSPKYPEGTDLNHLKFTGHQIIDYTGAGKDTPKDVENDVNFTHTITFDKVTGKTVAGSDKWTITDKDGKVIGNTDTHVFNAVDTPVVSGYHADKKNAGAGTVSIDNKTIKDTVTYTKNGNIVPVDKDSNPILGIPETPYVTNPKDPTKVVPDENVPKDPNGKYTPDKDKVTPEDPSKDTPVVYNPNPTVPGPSVGPSDNTPTSVTPTPGKTTEEKKPDEKKPDKTKPDENKGDKDVDEPDDDTDDGDDDVVPTPHHHKKHNGGNGGGSRSTSNWLHSSR